jgi:hypothetical protein
MIILLSLHICFEAPVRVLTFCLIYFATKHFLKLMAGIFLYYTPGHVNPQYTPTFSVENKCMYNWYIVQLYKQLN